MWVAVVAARRLSLSIKAATLQELELVAQVALAAVAVATRRCRWPCQFSMPRWHFLTLASSCSLLLSPHPYPYTHPLSQESKWDTMSSSSRSPSASRFGSRQLHCLLLTNFGGSPSEAPTNWALFPFLISVFCQWYIDSPATEPTECSFECIELRSWILGEAFASACGMSQWICSSDC